MTRPPKEGFAWAVAAASALPVALFPVYNPDLFWHLSAGRWIVEHFALPKTDFLSFTQGGRPWLDFEWLSQLLYYLGYAAAGFWGVWLLKALLVVAALYAFLGLLRALEINAITRITALSVFSIGLLSYSDARPDLFSLIFLARLLTRLESKTLKPVETLLLFSLWSNLHAGFALGLIALGLYAAAAWFSEETELAKTRGLCLAAAALGACFNPYGLGAYAVVWRHWREQALLARTVKEWGPLGFSNPIYWPAWFLLALLCAAAARRVFARERPLSWPLLGLTAYLAVAALAHQRAVIYLDLVGVAALATLAPPPSAALTVVLAAQFGFLWWLVPRTSIKGPFNPKFVPVQAAEFLGREKAAVSTLRVYNDWGWGGYLGFKLWPWYKVSSDGRYLFHEQHDEEGRAGENARAWNDYMTAKGYTAVLVPNMDRRFATTRRYKDGSTKDFARPWYLFYLPRERWALIYWDDQALFFVDRAAAPPDWLDEHEYFWMRPRDEEAFADALKRKEIAVADAAEEEKRHLFEVNAR